jgi:spore germination protein KC
MIKKITCIIFALLTVLLEGCWNNCDITDLGIVTELGIDKTADGNIELTFQIIDVSNQGGSQSGSSQSDGGSTIEVSSEGTTISDAARNIIPKLSKKAYYSQIQLVVISSEMAKEGFDKIWDFFQRDHEVSRLFRVLVVKNGTAKSVIEATTPADPIGAVEISDTIDNLAFGKSVKIQAFNVSELLAEPLTGLVTGVIDPDGSNKLTDMKIEGGAVFKNAKLAGFLDDDETRGYLFASNQIQNTILTIANPKETGDQVSIELISSSGTLKADLINGKPKLGIKITAYGNIGDEQGGADLTDLDDVKKLESESEALISENISDMLGKSQKTFDSDILNFNSMLYEHNYNDFEKIKGNWNKLYGDANISIKVQFLIKRSGLITKPSYDSSTSNQ